MDALPESNLPGGPADVTVVISTFNRARFLPEAIDSLLAQTPPPAHLVVVLDGCTDHTLDVLRPYAGRVAVRELPNGGKARALNAVLPDIKTEYCWFFDDDDVAYPGALAALLRPMRADPSLGFSFGAWDLVHTHELQAGERGKAVPYAWATASPDRQRLQLFRECTVMMTGALLRTDAVRAVGGLDNELIRSQDYDLMVRLASRYPFAFCGEPVYAWRQHEELRGHTQSRHSAADRLAIWAANSLRVGLHLRQSLPLASWAEAGSADAPTGRRQAFFTRAWALGPKVPIAMTVDDVLQGLRADTRTPLTSRERELLTAAWHHDFVAFRSFRGLWRLLGAAPSPVAADTIRCLATGLHWQVRGEPAVWCALKLQAASACLLLASWVLGARLTRKLIGSGHSS